MSAIAERAAARPVERTEELPISVIGPWRHGVAGRLEEIWRTRSLLPHMWKEFILRRYRRTYLSVIWIPLRPGIDILSRTLLFGGFLQVGSGDRPYFIYVAFASAGWTIFNSSLHWGARSMRQGKAITSGLYFPGAGLIGGSIGPVMVDFLLYSAVAIIGTFYYLIVQGRDYLAPPPQMVIGVLGLFLLLLFGLAFSLITAPLGLITKEIRYLISYVVQFWYFLTPVVYDLNHVPAKYRIFAELNPVTAPIEMVKFGFLSTGPPTTPSIISCVIGLGVMVFGGLAFFSRFERAAVERL